MTQLFYCRVEAEMHLTGHQLSRQELDISDLIHSTEALIVYVCLLPWLKVNFCSILFSVATSEMFASGLVLYLTLTTFSSSL